MNESICGDCGESFKHGEKIIGICQGRHICSGEKLEFEFYHISCWERVWNKGRPNDGEVMTVTAWRKKFREDFCI